MLRLPLTAAPFVLLFGCSALVQLDEEEYSGEFGSTGDSSPDSGGAGDGDGDGETGGGGGSPSGGGAIVTGGDGGSSSGGNGAGGTATGGTIMIPEPDHYYPLDNTLEDTVDAANADTNSVNWVNGVTNEAFEVGVDGWLHLPPDITSESPFTVSWWFIPTKSGYYALLSKVNPDSTDGGYAVVSDNNNVNVKVDSGFNFGSLTQHPSESVGTWIHVVFSYASDVDGTQDYLAVWVNGENAIEEQVVIDHDLLNATSYVRFGLQEVGGSSPWFGGFEGFIDEIRIYNRVLSADEVQALYQYDNP